MFQTLDHFLKSWEFEAAATQKLLSNLTDESLKQEITSQNWTLGRIAWHTVAAIRIITSNTRRLSRSYYGSVYSKQLSSS
ncbi:MAG: yrdA [Brevibacillus sp.]|nr:yrdA [Brevibacillus sp.]